MAEKIKILFDSFHLYHLPQFDPVIDLLSKDEDINSYRDNNFDFSNFDKFYKI